MTTEHESLAAQLAASLFGSATGDPFQDAMRSAAMAGAARLGEMGQTGFDTNTPFSYVNQAQYVGEGRKPFLLVSLITNTTYFVLVTEVADAGFRVAIAVHQEGQVPRIEHLRKMTLIRNTDGNVRAVAGW